MAAGKGQTLGALVIDLRANVAQLQADMDEIKTKVKQSSREMNSAMKSDFMETKQTLALVRDDLGVGIPREMRSVIASSELARDAILGIRDALIGIAFINIGVEFFEKIQKFF